MAAGGHRKIQRKCSDGFVWILFSGAPWHLLPDGYHPYQTCHRYFQSWTGKRCWVYGTLIWPEMEQTLKEHFAKAKIISMVGDRTYASDPLDKRLKGKGIELICTVQPVPDKMQDTAWQKAHALQI